MPYVNGINCQVTGIFPDFELNCGTIQIPIQFPFQDFTINSTNVINQSYSDYSIHLFKKRSGLDEHDFYQVFYKNGTRTSVSFGYLFPITLFNDPQNFIRNILAVSNPIDLMQELTAWRSSADEDGMKYIIYSQVLFSTFRLLLEHPISRQIDFEPAKTYQITDFYDDETYVLLCSNTRIASASISIDSLLANFFAYDFVPILGVKDFYLIHQVNIPNTTTTFSFKKMEVRPISPTLVTQQYIEEIFKHILKTELHPLMRFHILYQVIELLINEIGIIDYTARLALINPSLSAFIASPTPSVYHDAIEAVDDLKKQLKITKTEKERIQDLVKTKSRIMMNEHPNLSAAIDAVQPSGIVDNNCLGEKVYFIRNLLIHGYHRLKTIILNIDDLIKDVNKGFEKLIVQILIQYI